MVHPPTRSPSPDLGGVPSLVGPDGLWRSLPAPAGGWPTSGFKSGASVNRQIFRIALSTLTYSTGAPPKVARAGKCAEGLPEPPSAVGRLLVSRALLLCLRHGDFRPARVTIHRCRGVQGRAPMESTSNILTIKEVALAHPTRFVGMSNDHWPIRIPILQWLAVCRRAWNRLFWVPYLLAANT
jgi:hypothetical protein